MLRQRRWVGFSLLAVFFVLLFVRLSFWQMSRLHERRAANAVTRGHLAAPPLTYDELVTLARADASVATSEEWRAVRLTGRWDDRATVLVRNRTFDGNNGYEVVTPFRVGGTGPGLLVDRGWIPSGPTSGAPGSVPAAQEGAVTVTARLQPAEPERPSGGLPAGQTLSVSTAAIGRGLSYPLLPGYANLVSETPAPVGAPQVLDGPVLDDGPHLSYAVQWVLFALVAVGGWWTYLRREAEDQRQAAMDAAAADTDHASGAADTDGVRTG
jgi:cytochrome oxidase assembly protein ShyY1